MDIPWILRTEYYSALLPGAALSMPRCHGFWARAGKMLGRPEVTANYEKRCMNNGLEGFPSKTFLHNPCAIPNKQLFSAQCKHVAIANSYKIHAGFAGFLIISRPPAGRTGFFHKAGGYAREIYAQLVLLWQGFCYHSVNAATTEHP